MIPRRIEMQLATHETEHSLKRTDMWTRGAYAHFDGLPVYTSPRMRDGDVLACPSGFLVVGTRKDYVDSTIRRITREVFDQRFLEKIGMLEPTGKEVLKFCELRVDQQRERDRDRWLRQDKSPW